MEFRDHIRNEAADILGLKDKEKIHALLHWDRYFPNVPFSQQKVCLNILLSVCLTFPLTSKTGLVAQFVCVREHKSADLL